MRLELEDGRFGADVEAAAYFLVAEALANVAKHAGADEATVELAARRGALVVSVSDDGRGGADPLRGSGLHGLADRVAALGGTITRRQPGRRGHDAARRAAAMTP